MKPVRHIQWRLSSFVEQLLLLLLLRLKRALNISSRPVASINLRRSFRRSSAFRAWPRISASDLLVLILQGSFTEAIAQDLHVLTELLARGPQAGHHLTFRGMCNIE